jgi:hypothetical protein
MVPADGNLTQTPRATIIRFPLRRVRECAPRRAHHKITVSNADVRMMRAIERFILAYDGDNLLHDIEINFPGASYRAFFLAYGRAQALRWIEAEGAA